MRKFWCFLFVLWPILAIASCVIAPAMNWWFPGNRPSATPLGAQIDDLFYLILVIVTVAFIGTQIALAYVLWIGSGRATHEKAWFTHGSHNLEVIWTIVPSGVLLFIALYQMDVWAQFRIVSNFPEQAVADPIAEVTARQFEWRIRMPGFQLDELGNIVTDEQGNPQRLKLQRTPQSTDLYTVNDLHVPVNRPIMINLRSGDVQHSFFVPDLRVKQDAIPGQVIPVWFEVIREGDFDLTCAELCGWGHYKMRGRVLGQSENDYLAYLKKHHQEQWYDGAPKNNTQARREADPVRSALAQISSEVQK